MSLHLRSAALYTAMFAGVLTLAACGKSAPPAASPANASTAAAPAKATSVAAKPAVSSSAPAPAASAHAPATASTAAAAAASTAKAATPAPADAFKVASLAVGTAVNAEHKVRKPEDHFAQDQKTLYASVATLGDTDGATLNATWRYLEGKGQLVSSISQRVATSGPATTTFKVENPDLWPAGKYQVDISLDGKVVESKGFEIAKR
ncbi:hypothetical protein [Dyella sp. A6]|uniref:hypothetical protein n=1 Tax=Dyella aluminiiresistens TaxID=3069105 RepID=UPI002E7658ED|nr:hypothetical protein [Dyella sp. A6]